MSFTTKTTNQNNTLLKWDPDNSSLSQIVKKSK